MCRLKRRDITLHTQDLKQHLAAYLHQIQNLLFFLLIFLIKTQLINLAHEMTHAKQLITGQLQDHGIQLATAGDCQALVKVQSWEGETVTNVAYEDQPWEIEAYAMEREVYDKCFK